MLEKNINKDLVKINFLNQNISNLKLNQDQEYLISLGFNCIQDIDRGAGKTFIIALDALYYGLTSNSIKIGYYSKFLGEKERFYNYIFRSLESNFLDIHTKEINKGFFELNSSTMEILNNFSLETAFHFDIIYFDEFSEQEVLEIISDMGTKFKFKAFYTSENNYVKKIKMGNLEYTKCKNRNLFKERDYLEKNLMMK